MSESLLGLQENAVGDQDGRDGVPQSVQADGAMSVPAGEGGEPVPERAAGQPLAVPTVRLATARGGRTAHTPVTAATTNPLAKTATHDGAQKQNRP